MAYNQVEFDNRVQKRRFAISIIVRDPFGRPRGRKYYETDSSDSLADWYTRNSTNELDFPTAAARRRAEAKRRKKGRRKDSGNKQRNPKSKRKQTEKVTTDKG